MYRLAPLALLIAMGCSSDVSRSLGAQCEDRSDCDERCLRGDDYPDGMCTTSCERDRDCPTTARCVDEEGGICLFSCRELKDCEFLGQDWECKDKDAREAEVEEVKVCFGR